ncbi:hypothetical protein ACLOJK_037374 [Asimina triloba]
MDESSQSISDDSIDSDEESLNEAEGPHEQIARFEEIVYEECVLHKPSLEKPPTLKLKPLPPI